MSNPSLVVDFSFFPSNSLSCCTAYSSTGSTMYSTSKPFFRKFSKNGDDDTTAMLSPVMVVNVILPFLHTINVLLQTDLLITRLRCTEAQQLSNLGSIGRILMDSKFQALA